MLKNKINFLKKKMPKESFDLVLSIFREDVEFHKKFRSYTDEELCEVLGQSYYLVNRL